MIHVLANVTSGCGITGYFLISLVFSRIFGLLQIKSNNLEAGSRHSSIIPLVDVIVT